MRIVLGVSGGIAAYKAAEIARALIQNGHEVQTVMTRSARRFIQPLTFASLTGRNVITGMFSSASPEATLSSSIEHIGVAQECDLLLVAPATANIVGKLANGIANDFLSTMYLAFRGPVVIAPAMNNNMWSHPAVEANMQMLRKRGHIIVDPDEGFLACGTIGPGRLAEVSTIVEAVERALQPPVTDLDGETILITAGPTQEPLDPVRYLSNRSSGKMGYALAQAAVDRGARVILISGPVNLNPPPNADVVHVRTAQEMRDAVFANLDPATVVIKCAAVADFRPSTESKQKIKKTSARVSLELDPTPDILAELGRKRGERLLIGFAAETENLEKEARRKLETKNCDMVVANLVGQSETGFESDLNEVALALRTGEFIQLPRASKREIADQIPQSDSAAPPGGQRIGMTPPEIRQRLEFYRDLGIKQLYRREMKPAPISEVSPADVLKPEIELPGMAPAGDTLEIIHADIGDCTRCRLCKGRNKIVFGDGDAHAKLVFVGEGPGADEDAQGIPFVGRAGQLLTQMIEGTAAKEGIPLKRPDVYICNVVKCRPPENRTPEPDEMEMCGQFLFRQLSVIQPKAICALGSTAAKALLGGKDGVTKMRGKWHKWRDIPLMVTYHPSYLLRPYNQNAKKEAWEDLKKVLHFVYD